jgi:hypothetical protein
MTQLYNNGTDMDVDEILGTRTRRGMDEKMEQIALRED